MAHGQVSLSFGHFQKLAIRFVFRSRSSLSRPRSEDGGKEKPCESARLGVPGIKGRWRIYTNAPWLVIGTQRACPFGVSNILAFAAILAHCIFRADFDWGPNP
jgi:hypothetical protein